MTTSSPSPSITTRGSSPSSWRPSRRGSTSPSACPSSGPRRTTARPWISPGRVSPTLAAWRRRCAWPRPSARPVLERGPDLPVGVPLLDGLALLVLPLAPGQGELDLDPALVADVDPGRHHGQAPFLGLAGQPLDLAAVKEQPAVAERVVVEDIGRLVRADVAFDQEYLAVLHLGIAFLEADLPGPHRLDLAPDEGQAGLEGLEDDIVVRDRLVDGDGLHGSARSSGGAGAISIRAMRRLVIFSTVSR